MNINKIYLQKRLKVFYPFIYIRPNTDSKLLVATMSKNLESLGYIFSKNLFKYLSGLAEHELAKIYADIVPILRELRGSHRKFNPFYPNFPKQVMEMNEWELYANAIIHYWSFNLVDAGIINETWLPEYKKDERLPLYEKVKFDVIDLGSSEDIKTIFTQLISAKSSISASDKEIIEDFVRVYRDDIDGRGTTVKSLLPKEIPLKENVALLSSLLLKYTNSAGTILKRFVKTPTDVLRIACSFSGGDVSLAENTKFGKFGRKERRFLLTLLENCNTDLEEEMVKYRGQWLRLGEKLHPGEYWKELKRVSKAFQRLRMKGEKIITFNSKTERALKGNETITAVNLLKARPGELARRLDHILRISESVKEQKTVFKEFIKVAGGVATPVLLQLMKHFENRNDQRTRVIFPKGNVAKIQVLENNLPKLDPILCCDYIEDIAAVLMERFKKLPKLGNVYISEELKNYIVPFSQRSASKALKTIVRGSQVPLEGDYDTARFFVWWKEPKGHRTDLDLSGCLFNHDWTQSTEIAYYNLRDTYGCHSGDVTSAPHGACEFIDINMQKVLDDGMRYIVMLVNSFTQQPLCDLPECFAGWMGRKNPASGEVFEARTVKNKIDIASNTTISIPLIIDCQERKVIWADVALKQRPTWNNVRNNKNNIALLCKAITNLKKTTLHDLFSLHAQARGTIVTNKKNADIIFSETEGVTPFEIDKISAEYL